jgi:hypothetical protein
VSFNEQGDPVQILREVELNGNPDTDPVVEAVIKLLTNLSGESLNLSGDIPAGIEIEPIGQGSRTLTIKGSAENPILPDLIESIVYNNTAKGNEFTSGDSMVTIQLKDQLGKSSATRQIVVKRIANQRPTLAPTSSTLSFRAGDAPIALFPALNLSDDDTQILTATVNISGVGNNTHVVRSLPDTIGESTTPASRLIFSGKNAGKAPIDDFRALLASLSYQNTNDINAEGSFIATLSLTDARGKTSNVATSTVNLRPNQAPTLAISGAGNTFIEGRGAVPVILFTTTVTINDPDNDLIGRAEIELTNAEDNGQEELSVDEDELPEGIAKGTSSSHTLELTGQASYADYVQALKAVRYTNNADEIDTSDRTIAFTVFDARGKASSKRNVTLRVAESDTPLVTLTGSRAALNEGALPEDLIKNTIQLTVTDEDEIAKATVRLNPRPDGSEEKLAANGKYGVDVSYNNGTGVLTLFNNATAAQYTEVLRSLSYTNEATSPTAGQREVTFIITDTATTASTAVSFAFNLSTSIDPPQLGLGTINTLSYTENKAQVDVISTLVITAPDSTFNGGSLLVRFDPPISGSGGNQNDQLTLSANRISLLGGEMLYTPEGNPAPPAFKIGTTSTFTADPGDTLSFNFSEGITPAILQYLMRNVTYRHLSDAPRTDVPHTVSFELQDEHGNTVSIARPITVVAVNDAPVLTDGVNLDVSSVITANNGILISKLFDDLGGNYLEPDDGDGPPLARGIALMSKNTANTANDLLRGEWQFSTDNGVTWNCLFPLDDADLPAGYDASSGLCDTGEPVAANDARVLLADDFTRLRLVATSGTGSLELQAYGWDTSDNLANGEIKGKLNLNANRGLDRPYSVNDLNIEVAFP